jgi:hypothetical protein
VLLAHFATIAGVEKHGVEKHMARIGIDGRQIAAILTAAYLSAIPSAASASKFNDCKNAALTRYGTAVLTSNVDDAKRAIIESTACDRFISELPKEEQEKIKTFQDEMYKFQLEQTKSTNKI